MTLLANASGQLLLGPGGEILSEPAEFGPMIDALEFSLSTFNTGAIIENGKFATGTLAGWTAPASVTVVPRASGTAGQLASPEPNMAWFPVLVSTQTIVGTRFAAAPGVTAQVSLQVGGHGTPTSITISITIKYLSAGLVVLQSSTTTSPTYTDTAWRLFVSNITPAAPAGTAWVQVEISRVPVGSGAAYVTGITGAISSGVEMVRATLGDLPEGAAGYRLMFVGPSHPAHAFTVHGSGNLVLGPASAVLGPFGSTGYADVIPAVIWEDDTLGAIGRTFTRLAQPGQPSFTLTTGTDPGEYVLTYYGGTPGDAVTIGDAAGGALTTRYSVGGGAFSLLGDGSLSAGEVVTLTATAGSTVSVVLRNDSAYLEGVTSDPQTVVAKANPPVAPPPVFTPQATINAVEGDPLSLDFSTMFTGAVSWVVVSGIEGAASSGTGNRNYTLASLPAGSHAVQVRGINADGVGTTGTIAIEVAEAIVPVAWTADPPDTVVPVGTAQVTRNLATMVSGSGPITFYSPQDAADARFSLSSAGSLVIAPANATSATTQIEVVATGPGSDNAVSAFFDLGAFADAPATPVAGTDVVVVDSVYMFGGETWRRPRFRFPGLPAGLVPQWGSGALVNGTLPESKWESFEDLGGGFYAPQMADPAKRGNPSLQSPTRLDYSVWSVTGVDVSRNILVRFRNPTTGLASMPTDYMVVPLVAPAAPEVTYLPYTLRRQSAFDAGVVGNTGQQFERVGTWNQGRLDPEKRGTWLGGQDENNIWATFNGTDKTGPALMGSPRQEGFWTCNMTGLYCDSDDNIMLALGSKSAVGGSGLYASRDWGETFYKFTVTRPVADANGSTAAFSSVMNGSSMRCGQQMIARRPQNAAGTLTPAQRPIWIVEEIPQPSGTNSIVGNVFIWKSVDAGATIEYVRPLTPHLDFVGTKPTRDPDGLFYIDVAPNGDVLIATAKGIWWTSDGFATINRSTILGSTADRWVSQAVFKGGSSTTPSGAYAAITNRPPDEPATNIGLLRTDNIRTTGFTRPAGQSGTNSSGAAADMTTYRAVTVAVAPGNGNRLLIGGLGREPMISTNGGTTFTGIIDRNGVGDNRGTISGEVAQFWWHPTDPDIVMATTSQTLSRSIDGGLTFDVDNCAFFDGSHDRGWGFDGAGLDWRKQVFVQQDYYVRYSNEAPDWFYSSGIDRNKTYNGQTFLSMLTAFGQRNDGFTSGSGVAFLTDTRIVAGMNYNTQAGRNMLILMEDPTPASVTPSDEFDTGRFRAWLPRNDLGTTRAKYSISHPTNHDMLFVGRFRLTNLAAPTMAGVVFTDMVRQISDMFVLNGTTISYWVNDDHGGTEIWRSTAANGGSQTLWYTAPSTFSCNASTPDPFNAERFLYSRSSDNGNIREIKRVGGVLTDTQLFNIRTSLIIPYLDKRLGFKVAFTGGSQAPEVGEVITRGGVTGTLLSVWPTTGSWGGGNQAGYMMVTGISGTFAAGAATTPSGGAFTISGAQTASYTVPSTEIKTITADHNRPGLFYCTALRWGAPVVFMSIDGGATWEDITDDCPRTETEVAVHPLTGDVMTFGSKGRRVREPFAGERINVSASSGLTDDAILTQGAVTARIRRRVLTGGAGYIVVTGRTGGNFASGAATATGSGTATLSGAQTGYPALPDLGKVSAALRTFYSRPGVPRPPKF